MQPDGSLPALWYHILHRHQAQRSQRLQRNPVLGQQSSECEVHTLQAGIDELDTE